MPSQCFADRCSPGRCGGENGWTTRYSVNRRGELSVRLEIHVMDLTEGGIYSAYLPFVVDTGAPFTMVPRALLNALAFRPGTNYDVRKIVGVGGGTLDGYQFAAALALRPTQGACEVLAFDSIQLFVCDTAVPFNHGLLGLDVLRQVVTTFDGDGARFTHR